jgi:hypothetical protein
MGNIIRLHLSSIHKSKYEYLTLEKIDTTSDGFTLSLTKSE